VHAHAQNAIFQCVFALTNLSFNAPTTGITEQWEDSVRLFHKLHGGALHSDELVHQRSAKEAVRRTQEALLRVLKKEIGADPYDTALYAEASRSFYSARRHF
jgi:hypothetical protein